jgi:hypothetical protein
MLRIHGSILAFAVLAAALLPGQAQAGRTAGVFGTSGSVVFVDGRHAHRAVLGAHRGRHFRRIVVVSPVVVSPFGVVRTVAVPAFTVPSFTVPSFTVPTVTVATGAGFVVLNNGFAVTNLNGFTTGSIGPFTTFSNSVGTVPVIVTGVGHSRSARVAFGHGMSMAGRR